MIARDIVNTDFKTVSPTDSIADAVNAFHKASVTAERKIFGLMVTDKLVSGVYNPSTSQSCNRNTTRRIIPATFR